MKIFSFGSKFLFLALVIWGVFSVYLIKNDHLIPRLKSKLGLLSESGGHISNNSAKTQIKDFIHNFYTYNSSTLVEKNKKTLRNSLTSESADEIVFKYTKIMKNLVYNSIFQEAVIQNIIREVDSNSFVTFFKLKQTRENQDISKSEYLIRLAINLKLDKSGNIFISQVDETLLRNPNELLKKQSIHIGSNGILEIELPCKIKRVIAQTEESNIAQTNTLDSKTILFKTNEQIKSENFKVDCKQKTYPLSLVAGNNYTTLFQKISASAGRPRYKKKRVLTPGEKDALEAFGLSSTQN
ncbi:MAG: hypothetical protein KDD33_09520 [Bdellovibrionales bacterium]|nr:hypothetical protein [Bdellovibrionales bacterium]